MNNMYQIKITETPTNHIKIQYAIGADLVIFNRETFRNGKLERADIGISVDELIDIVEVLKIRKFEYKKGIEPPVAEWCHTANGYLD